jgi:hypothetical protein
VTESPYEWGQARDAINTAKAAQKAAEDNVRDAYKTFGLARRAYQTALAQRILELRAEGVAATICPDLARGDKHVADLRFQKDVAEGVMEAARSAVWRHTADRRELEQLVDWSMRRELAEGAGVQWSPRAAA